MFSWRLGGKKSHTIKYPLASLCGWRNSVVLDSSLRHRSLLRNGFVEYRLVNSAVLDSLLKRHLVKQIANLTENCSGQTDIKEPPSRQERQVCLCFLGGEKTNTIKYPLALLCGWRNSAVLDSLLKRHLVKQIANLIENCSGSADIEQLPRRQERQGIIFSWCSWRLGGEQLLFPASVNRV